MASNASYIDKLTEDFQRAVWGRPVLTLNEAAELLPYGREVLLQAIETGELAASRRSKKGKITLSCRRLAEWIYENEKHTLPRG